MSLKGLIENQTIIIDDHKRGAGEVKNWDNPAVDVHIDKKTDYPIDGKKQEVRIRIPINSERELTIENGRGKNIDIPNQLRREIRKAFENKKSREDFIKDVIATLKDFNTILSSEDRVRQVLKNLSRHFDLKWTEIALTTYTNEILELYTELYTDDAGNEFYITVDKEKIKIGQNNGYARHQKGLKRK